IWQHLRLVLVASVVLGVLLVAMLTPSFQIRAAIGLVLAFWIIFATIAATRERIRHSTGIFSGLASLPLGYFGMSLAHIGFAFTIIGVSITSQYSTEIHRRMGVGD